MKIKVEAQTTETGVRILTTECPGPMTCKAGSTACSLCPFHLRRAGDYVYCSFGRKKQLICNDCASLGVTPQRTRPDILFCGQTGREVKASDKCSIEAAPMTIPCVEELERQPSDAKARLNWHPAEPTIKDKPEPPPMKPPRAGMTPQDRIDSYVATTDYPRNIFLGEDGRIVGTWIMGNNYTVKSGLYGGYPHGYLKRIKALFPDKSNVLHLFSGCVDLEALPGKTCDINPERNPDYVDDAQTLKSVPVEQFDLICADPPYSVEDCEHYGVSMVKRNLVMKTLGARMTPGAHVVWLDQVLPVYRKDQFTLEATIGMMKSTNHRFRLVTIFRRV